MAHAAGANEQTGPAFQGDDFQRVLAGQGRGGRRQGITRPSPGAQTFEPLRFPGGSISPTHRHSLALSRSLSITSSQRPPPQHGHSGITIEQQRHRRRRFYLQSHTKLSLPTPSPRGAPLWTKPLASDPQKDRTSYLILSPSMPYTQRHSGKHLDGGQRPLSSALHTQWSQ